MSATSMSAGLMPATAKARAEDALQPKSTRLGAATMCSCVWPWPAPRMATARRPWLSVGRRLITNAAPPSDTRQQSSRCSGELISFEFITSSIESGSRLCALG